MENEENQFENLENLTQEELDALDADQANDSINNSDTPIDYKTKFEAAERKAATLQRILNKKSDKTNNNKINNNTELEKDIAEIKFINKVSKFAENNNISKSQAEIILNIYPNATAETLKDPFIIGGLNSIASKERLLNNTPGAKSNISANNTKSYSEMNEKERKEWYANQ